MVGGHRRDRRRVDALPRRFAGKRPHSVDGYAACRRHRALHHRLCRRPGVCGRLPGGRRRKLCSADCGRAERGYFRHETTEVSSLLGGSSATNTEGKLGFQLPPTEKLVLLVKRKGIGSTGTPKQKIAIKGSLLYSIPDIEIVFAADSNFTSGEKLYTIDLYNFGLYISGVEGEDGITIFVASDKFTDNKSSMEFALIARMG